MCREILFRGKWIDNGEWVYGSGVFDDSPNKAITWFDYKSIELAMLFVIPETVGQYTGLTDKNGRKIFDGDVCRVIDGIEYQGAYEFDKVGIIKWHGIGFDFCINDVGYGLGNILSVCNIEIVGNIHDQGE